MKSYSAKDIRNIALVGHGGKGKTTLAEAMLFNAGVTDRLGRVQDGNTVLDFDAEERKRKVSVSTSMAPIEWKGVKINIIDVPGMFDFAGGASEGMRAADCALIVLSAKTGFGVGAEKAMKAAAKRGISKILVISKTDTENANFYRTHQSIKERIGTAACPVIIPLVADNQVHGYVNLIENKAYEFDGGVAKEVPVPTDDHHVTDMLEHLKESVASVDEALMEKFFGGEEFTKEEILSGLRIGLSSGDIVPIVACSGYMNEAVDMLLDFVKEVAPDAESFKQKAKTEDGEDIEIAVDPSAPLSSIVFKTVADPFVGKLSYIKVITGTLKQDATAYNPRTGQTEKIGKVLFLKGGKQEDAGAVVAGDICAVAKLGNVNTGDTLCDPAKKVVIEGIDFPVPCLSMAVKVKKKGEEDKVAQGLHRLAEEDPTISFYTNTETHQQILSGLGEQHLDVVISKLKGKFGVEVELEVPKVAYRETIRKKVKVQGRHKKQSGGHGQFGDVWIEFEPCESDDLVFEEKVFGGAVPKNFFPAVEKGLRDCVVKGVLAGYPVVGLKATLVDGSYHPVDSSEMSFKMAASIAYKTGIPQANPVLLEPINEVKIYVPDDNMGDIISDITKRRGSVLGTNATEDKLKEIIVDVPASEMGNFATAIRSITQGRGYFISEFSCYREAPANVAQKVIEAYKASGADAE